MMTEVVLDPEQVEIDKTRERNNAEIEAEQAELHSDEKIETIAKDHVVTINNSNNNTLPQTQPTDTAKDKVDAVLDIPYLLSPPGIVKIVELVIGIICIGCSAHPFHDAHKFFLSVAIIFFTVTFVLLILSTFRLVNRLTFKWELGEIIYGILATVLYLISSIVMAVFSMSSGAYVTAAIFGLLNTVAYGASTVFSFREWQYVEE